MTSRKAPHLRNAASAILLLTACTSFSRVSLGAEAAPAAQPPFVVNGYIRAQGVDLDNGDLGTSGSDNLGAASLEGELQVTANINDDTRFFWEGRGVASAGRGSFESADTGGISNGESFLEWRQSYFEFDNIDKEPVSARIGRQKIREPYGLWWNQNFDSGRLLYQTTEFSGNITAGQNLFDYSTSSNSFSNNDRDVARVAGEASWQYWYDNFFEARLMYQDDHSSVAIGQIEDPGNLDMGTSNLVWGGVRAAGHTHFLEAGDQQLAYRVDLLGVTGDEDLAVTAPSGSNRIVTAINSRDVRGWGFDAATDIPVPVFDRPPLIHLGYAYGSGDGNPAGSTDHAFRQDGLAGNFSQLGALSVNTDNYGTVLRPQLSNIHILSAGVTSPVFEASDVGAIYRYYRLADATTALPSSGIEDNLDGVDKGLGQGLDFLFNVDVLKEAHLTPTNHVSDVTFRSSLGFFWAGKAYGAGDGDVATRGLVELKVGF